MTAVRPTISDSSRFFPFFPLLAFTAAGRVAAGYASGDQV